MRCPYCGHAVTSVIDSRLSQESNTIRRRRECESCKRRFTTLESADLSFPRVIKTDKSTESFSKDKIKNGVELSLEKRQISYDDLEETLNSIYNQCLSFSEKIFLLVRLVKFLMAELLKLDHVAYLRFASVYLNFDDMASFRNVIKVLEKDLSPEMKKKQINLLDDEDG
ncbi:MAG: transcriptional repressor NrdR [Gammaproteobacteria bacterium]|nr:MAG: transcriptional repressor NrdR [Gammaproteobacteria bacterium]